MNLTDMSIRDLKQRLAALGGTLPKDLTEKHELVSLVRSLEPPSPLRSPRVHDGSTIVLDNGDTGDAQPVPKKRVDHANNPHLLGKWSKKLLYKHEKPWASEEEVFILQVHDLDVARAIDSAVQGEAQVNVSFTPNLSKEKRGKLTVDGKAINTEYCAAENTSEVFKTFDGHNFVKSGNVLGTIHAGKAQTKQTKQQVQPTMSGERRRALQADQHNLVRWLALNKPSELQASTVQAVKTMELAVDEVEFIETRAAQ